MKRLMILLQPSVASKRLILHLHCITQGGYHLYIEILRLNTQNQGDVMLQSALTTSMSLLEDSQSQMLIRFHVEIDASNSSSVISSPQVIVKSVNSLPQRSELNDFRKCEAWQQSIAPVNVSKGYTQHAVACVPLWNTHDSQVHSIQLVQPDEWENEEFWIGLKSDLHRQIIDEPYEILCRQQLAMELNEAHSLTNSIVYEFNITHFIPFSFLSLFHPLANLFSSQDYSYVNVSEALKLVQQEELVIMLPIRETLTCTVLVEHGKSLYESDVESLPIQVTAHHSSYAADVGLIFNMTLLKQVWNRTQEEMKEKTQRQLSEETQESQPKEETQSRQLQDDFNKEVPLEEVMQWV